MTTLNLQSENCKTMMLQLADGSTGRQQWYTETQELGELLLKNSQIVKLCHEPIECRTLNSAILAESASNDFFRMATSADWR